VTFVLIYHDLARIGEEDRFGLPGPAAARYKLDPGRFETHLEAITRAGVRVGLVDDGPDAALTFDDGGASSLQAAEALERRHWRGHFLVITGRIATPGFLDGAQIRELIRRGHEVGSHSHSHPTYMGTLTRKELAREWRQSADVLGEITGSAPRSASVPGGFVSREVIDEAAGAGYRLLMTSQPTAKTVWRDGMRIQGRYTIWASTSRDRAAAYARGERVARGSLWLAWQLKSAPKRLSPRAYEAVRQAWARRGRPR
jgi:peptidoglycan/xylan/chitin deacetylase (PgdA/CDA1 family)